MYKQPHHILIVEDERDINDLLAFHLKKESYDVSQAFSAEEAIENIGQKTPSLVLLDLMLPKKSGFDLCKSLKDNPHNRDIYILMLTAKSERQDIINGLNMGADDYVTKPFDIEEVIARVKAILRRSPLNRDLKKFEYKKMVIDWMRHKVYVNRNAIHLTLTEFKIIKVLIENQGRVLTRDRLLDLVFGQEASVIDRTIDVHIQAVRKKLGVKNSYIETIRGVGYRFRDE